MNSPSSSKFQCINTLKIVIGGENHADFHNRLIWLCSWLLEWFLLICVTICIGIGVVARLKYGWAGDITLSIDVCDDQGDQLLHLLFSGQEELTLRKLSLQKKWPRDRRVLRGSALGRRSDLGNGEMMLRVDVCRHIPSSLFGEVLVRRDMCHDSGADWNLTAADAPSASSFSELQRGVKQIDSSSDLKSRGVTCSPKGSGQDAFSQREPIWKLE